MKTTAVLIFTLAAGCAHSSSQSTVSVEEAYRSAVKDAEVARPDEVMTTLVEIKPGNSAVLFSEDGRQVLVAKWIDDSTRNGHFPPPWTAQAKVTLPGFVAPSFVTLPSELRRACGALGLTKLKGEALAMRMRQLLGLKPDDSKQWVAEMWVPVERLARPCPDPEITDDRCDVLPQPKALPAWSGYEHWFNDNKAHSYEQGYPWTRLGYTYDWGGRSHVGLSEFVILPGTEYRVARDPIRTDDYCAAPPLKN